MLSGKKTYLVAALVAVATFAQLAGLIDAETFQVVMGLLASLGLYTVRDAIKKLE